MHFIILVCTLLPAAALGASTIASAAATPAKVAVIGAGAGGTSAAFWLSLARSRDTHLNIAVDVYEKSDYVGGRAPLLFSVPML
jgi:prenylcysteine oxidase/farnesylcysteine lyase